MVHWNKKYASFSEAAGKTGDGLAVLGFMFQVGAQSTFVQVNKLDIIENIFF